LRRCHHHDSGSSLSFYSSLQRVGRTTFRTRATPGVNRNIRCLGRVRVAAPDPGGSQKPLHALDVTSRCAIALIHIAATNPFCAGGHPDLVASAVIADRGAGGMRAVEVIITRKR
jgi:hypothetical protein